MAITIADLIEFFDCQMIGLSILTFLTAWLTVIVNVTVIQSAFSEHLSKIISIKMIPRAHLIHMHLTITHIYAEHIPTW